MIPVRDYMTKDVVVVIEQTPIAEAAKILTQRRITGMPVVDGDGAVVGIVSEFDLMTKRGQTVGDIMSREVISVSEDTSLDDAARIVATERIRRLPVTRHGRLVGMITRKDMVYFLATCHWVCRACGETERGFVPPGPCPSCGAAASEFFLECGLPGM